MKLSKLQLNLPKAVVETSTLTVISLIMFFLGFYSPVFWLIALIPVLLIICTLLKAIKMRSLKNSNKSFAFDKIFPFFMLSFSPSLQSS